MKTRIEVKKVKLKDGRVKIEYDTYPGDSTTPDHYSLDSIEQPKGSFIEAMEALGEHLVDICELPKEFTSRVTVIGVSLSWTDTVMGATITGLLKLKNSNAPLVLNTPHKPEAPYSEGADESNLLPDEAIDAIRYLLREAEGYIAGNRKFTQMDLFNAPDGKLRDAAERLLNAAEAACNSEAVAV